MSKKKGKKGEGASSNSVLGFQRSIPLRRLTKCRKIRTKFIDSNLTHLHNLAVRASEQSSLSSLAAFFGQRLAAAAESLALAPDPSLFLCKRCETVLQPDSNCSVRIEKRKTKAKKHNKCSNLTQNNVVYYCHYCSCRNVKRGTPKGHMKVICARRSEEIKQSKAMECRSEQKDMEGKDENGKESTAYSSARAEEIGVPATPPSKTGGFHTIDTAATPGETRTTLLTPKKKGKKKRKRSTSEKQNEPQTEPINSCASTDGEKTVSSSKRRKKKSWTSLKEIAQTNEQRGKLGVSNDGDCLGQEKQENGSKGKLEEVQNEGPIWKGPTHLGPIWKGPTHLGPSPSQVGPITRSMIKSSPSQHMAGRRVHDAQGGF